MNSSLFSRSMAAALGLISSVAGAAPFEYDCDSAAAVFSELKQSESLGTPVSVRGVVTARTFRTHANWLPAAAVSVKKDGGDMVMLRIAAVQRDKGPLNLELLTTFRGTQERQVLLTMPTDKPVEFSILSNGDGLDVSLGGQQRHIKFPMNGSSATSVSCSTGEFLFTDLRFGE